MYITQKAITKNGKKKAQGEIVLSTDNLPWAEKSLYFEMVIDG